MTPLCETAPGSDLNQAGGNTHVMRHVAEIEIFSFQHQPPQKEHMFKDLDSTSLGTNKFQAVQRRFTIGNLYRMFESW